VSLPKKELGKFAYNPVFIETGTNEGRCVQIALDLGFEKIISIEQNFELHIKAVQRFDRYDNVNLIWGDSADMLGKVLRKEKRPVTFYLDAHISRENEQLFLELNIIKEGYVKGSVLLIDDIHTLFADGDNKKLVSKLYDIDRDFEISLIDGISKNHATIRKNDILVAEVRRGT